MARVAALGCIVCRNLGYFDSPAEIHHVRYLAGGGQRASHMDVIPLCPLHHRTGGYGDAFHAGPGIWQATYGTERDLLRLTRELIGIEKCDK